MIRMVFLEVEYAETHEVTAPDTVSAVELAEMIRKENEKYVLVEIEHVNGGK